MFYSFMYRKAVVNSNSSYCTNNLLGTRNLKLIWI